jgi:hypothetical protein
MSVPSSWTVIVPARGFGSTSSPFIGSKPASGHKRCAHLVKFSPAIKAAVAACKTEGARVNDDMKRVIDKKTQPSTNFYLREETTK